jgi:hypothetical protein
LSTAQEQSIEKCKKGQWQFAANIVEQSELELVIRQLTFAEGREQQIIDQGGTGVMAHQSHSGGIATEGPDVLADPRESHGDVVEGEVAAEHRIRGRRYRLCPQKTCRLQSSCFYLAFLSLSLPFFCSFIFIPFCPVFIHK